MCGLTGILRLAGGNAIDGALAGRAAAMAATLVHRGPDGAGVWADEAAGIALAHRRLAVVDLSPAGDQPMRSADGRWTLVFNGEIYDHRRDRADLERAGVVFRGHSDTEVLLEAVAAWGVEEALGRAGGMFALALWDARERTVHLARDRIGEKPLYYARTGAALVFASEPRALLASGLVERAVDRAAVEGYLRLGYVPGPACIWAGVRRVPPGSLLSIPVSGSGNEVPRAFWDPAALARAPATDGAGADTDEALVTRVETLLGGVVEDEMIADVPLGAFLSGGIDSSLLVALMRRGGRRVRTFTAAFDDPRFDESPHARAVAAHLGSDHVEVRVSSREALDLVPDLAGIWDEPFADASAIPAHLVSRAAREHLTVALTGDGADELFGGYNRYVAGERVWRACRGWPGGARRFAAALLDVPPARAWAALEVAIAHLPGGGRAPRHLADKSAKLAACLRARDPDALYRVLAEGWGDSAAALSAIGGAVGVEPSPPAPPGARRCQGVAEGMMYRDLTGALPDDMLVKVDRAAMAVGLETRAPFLHHRVVEAAWALPARAKIRDGRGKWILRRILARHLPPALFERPKTGFEVPLGAWLRGPLRDWAESLLGERELREDATLDAAAVRRAWDEHLAGRRNRHYALWTVLCLQAWKARWLAA